MKRYPVEECRGFISKPKLLYDSAIQSTAIFIQVCARTAHNYSINHKPKLYGGREHLDLSVYVRIRKRMFQEKIKSVF